ncbi:MAG: VCBS repeat-containing protein [Planctomycetota bacterium]
MQTKRILLVLLVLAVAGGAVVLSLRKSGVPETPRGFLQRPGVFVTEFEKSEAVFDVASGAVKKSFMKALKARDWASAAASLTPDFRGRFPRLADGAEVQDRNVSIRAYKASGLPELKAEAFLAAIREQTEGWTQVERTTWRPFEFLLDPAENQAYLSIHFQLAGPLPDGRRIDLAGEVKAIIVRAGETWKVRELGWEDGSRLEAKFVPWADVTEQTGFTFNDSPENARLVQELINARRTVTVGGLIAADVNGDGFPDLISTRAEQDTNVFLNDGRGGFTRGQAPILEGKLCPRSFLLLDLDGDGVEELVSGSIDEYEEERAWADIWVRNGDSWKRRPRALEFRIARATRDIAIEAIVPTDVDGDGRLDLYFGAYSTRDSRTTKFNRIAAYDGADNLLFMNHGGLKFTEESDQRGIRGTQYTFVAKTFDFDGDGDLDLWDGNDYGPNALWLNDGTGKFVEGKGHILQEGSNYTMGVTIADWDNTGAWSMYISNMYSHAGNRIVPLAADLGEDIKKAALVLAVGNQMYERDEKTKAWRETGVFRGVNWADWSWATLFLDGDNDGDKDLFVANGYTSNQDAQAPDY